MWDARQYELLDFGNGRRLERFGPLVLDRPCPGAEKISSAAPQLWATADARFDRDAAEQGRWTVCGEAAAAWTVNYGSLTFELKRTDFGHVGLFPEQAENWDWLRDQVAALGRRIARPPKVLNLFAYTGGSTLAAAAAGAEVTHVDAARNVVAWARRNAELSGLAHAPIRWIADDAAKFVVRELRRGKRYDGVVLDPPSYGHGAQGEPWQLDHHLGDLLVQCARLTGREPQCVLLTCHTPGYRPERLRELLRAAFSTGLSSDSGIMAADLVLRTAAGRALQCGAVGRRLT